MQNQQVKKDFGNLKKNIECQNPLEINLAVFFNGFPRLDVLLSRLFNRLDAF